MAFLLIGQAVQLRAGSEWNKVIKPGVVGVVIGVLGSTHYQVAFPTGDGEAPLVGRFSSEELLLVQRG